MTVLSVFMFYSVKKISLSSHEGLRDEPWQQTVFPIVLKHLPEWELIAGIHRYILEGHGKLFSVFQHPRESSFLSVKLISMEYHCKRNC